MRLLILILCLSGKLYAKDGVQYLIMKEAMDQGFDPSLALAIAQTESNLNQSAVGPKGEIGVFQLRPEFHKGNLKKLSTNIRTGIRYLTYLQKRLKPYYGDAWFVAYNVGPGNISKIRHLRRFDYYMKVTKRLNYIATNGP